jgi:N-acetylneuraminic acid mutarotase
MRRYSLALLPMDKSLCYLLSLVVVFGHTTWALSEASQTSNQKEYCWKALTPVPGGLRQEHGAAALQNSIYVVGGVRKASATATMATTSSVDIYHVDTNQWSKAAPLPMELHHPNVVAANGYIYVLGGLHGGFPWQMTPNSYRYDPKANKWDTLAPMPAPARGSSILGVHGQTIYVAGGLRAMGTATDAVSSYDIASGNWTVRPRLPEARDHSGGGFIGDDFYVVGGRVGSPTARRGTVYVFSPAVHKWTTERASMPSQRGGIAVAIVGTKIYTFGGEGNPTAGTKGVYSNSEMYDTVSNSWSKEVPMKVPRHGTAAVTVGDGIYIPGGGAAGGGGAEPVDTNDAYVSGPC